MKKCCHAMALPYRMYSTGRYCSKNKPAAVAPKETITHHFFVSGIGAEENCRCSQNLCGAENVDKRSQQTFMRELLGFVL